MSCQTSELTFAYPQTVTRDYLKIKLLGKHTISNAINANGVVVNAEGDRLPPAKAYKTICVQCMK
jgi:hypothetical protein